MSVNVAFYSTIISYLKFVLITNYVKINFQRKLQVYKFKSKDVIGKKKI